MSTDAMELDHPHPHLQPRTKTIIKKTSHSLTQQTLSSPPFSYIHLSTSPLPSLPSTSPTNQPLDNLLLRSYLTTALRQFLGDTGVAIPVDILSCTSRTAWIRVPRQDLGAFAGAITAFPGLNQGGETTLLLLQIKACGDFLGSLLGKGGEDEEERGWDVWKS
ncbi:hypothetical protein QBC44DRAFT_314859 [Cladorrhinum sp. PSN332]|nr:hypothetical protein QBC44DRAFT_314859 [Cladorrhinum sp. PSN332]